MIVRQRGDGSAVERATRVLAAGCDVVLHCDGVLADMEAVAPVVPLPLTELLSMVPAAGMITLVPTILMPSLTICSKSFVD